MNQTPRKHFSNYHMLNQTDTYLTATLHLYREEQESWNSSRIDKFCPKAEYGILELACIDNKNETMGMNSNWVNTTRFSRLCDLNTGLICRPNKEHCPDYRIKYKCRCPKTSSTSMAVSSSSTAVAPTGTSILSVVVTYLWKNGTSYYLCFFFLFLSVAKRLHLVLKTYTCTKN